MSNISALPTPQQPRGEIHVPMAEDFATRWGIDDVLTVAEFDEYLIGKGYMADPGVRAPSNPLWAKTVQERKTYRDRINSGATSPSMPGGSEFYIAVQTPGEVYIVQHPAEAFKDQAQELPHLIRSHQSTKGKQLRQLFESAGVKSLPVGERMLLEMQLDAIDHLNQMINLAASLGEAANTKLIANIHTLTAQRRRLDGPGDGTELV